VEGMSKTTKSISQDSRFLSQVLNPGTLEYEAGTTTFGAKSEESFSITLWDK
jgi:hypothetical protein